MSRTGVYNFASCIYGMPSVVFGRILIGEW